MLDFQESCKEQRNSLLYKLKISHKEQFKEYLLVNLECNLSKKVFK